MIYLTDRDIAAMGNRWSRVAAVLRQTAGLLYGNNCTQPGGTVMQYSGAEGSIAAMPAYLGGSVDTAGICCTSTFPGMATNPGNNTHAVVILHHAATGTPVCIISSSTLTAVKEAGLSSLAISSYIKAKNIQPGTLRLGIHGFDAFGQTHLEMCASLFDEYIGEVIISDGAVDETKIPATMRSRVKLAACPGDAYSLADIFVEGPWSGPMCAGAALKPGSLHCNTTLHNYSEQTLSGMSRIMGDRDKLFSTNPAIKTICAPGTAGAEKMYTFSTHELGSMFSGISSSDTVIFSTAGMPAFDISIGCLYYNIAAAGKTGRGSVSEGIRYPRQVQDTARIWF